MTDGRAADLLTPALAAGLALALVLGAATGDVVLAMAAGLAQVLLPVGWFPALGAAGSPVGRVVAVLAALAADVAVLRADETRPMQYVAPVLALGLLAAFGQQLVRRNGRPGLTGSITATSSAVVVGGLGSAWVALGVSEHGTALVVLAASAAALAPVADLLVAWLPRWVAAVLAVAGTGAVALAVAAQSSVDGAVVAAAAAAAAVTARLGVVLANRVPAPSPVLPAVLPVLLVAPAAYVVARVLLG